MLRQQFITDTIVWTGWLLSTGMAITSNAKLTSDSDIFIKSSLKDHNKESGDHNKESGDHSKESS